MPRPRRARKGKPAIGKDGGNPTEPKFGYKDVTGRGPATRGQKSLEHSMPTILHNMMEGGGAISFPTYDPLFTARTKVMQISLPAPDPSGFSSGPGVPLFTSGLANDFTIIAQSLIDNLARAYANAQGLSLTSTGDLVNYIGTYLAIYGRYAGLCGILNGDGFNDRMQQIAIQGITRRSRIQTGMDRLQSLPFPPGLIDIAERCLGCFATYVGGDVILSMCDPGTSGSPVDLTSGANWDTLLAGTETLLEALVTGAEAGVIRIILAEYYGDPTPFPFYGIKVGRSLFDEKQLMGAQFLGATNVFANPYLITGAGTISGGAAVPILIPKGCETDPWWSTLYRVQPVMMVNNQVKANAGSLGLFRQDIGFNSQLRWYSVGGTTSNNSQASTPFNGYTDPMNEFYFWPPVGNSEIVGYANDTRSQRDFELFNIALDTIVNNTMMLTRKIYLEKARFPLPPDISNWTTERLFNRTA